MGVAGEHLIAQGKAIEGHDEGDAYLLAVGPMIAGIAALCLRVGFQLALEIGAGDIVEQHVVLDREQLPAALRQMRFQFGLGCEQMIEAAIEPILVDLLIPELQQIAKRRAPVPTFRDVQLARWLAESCRHQHGRNLRPRDVLLADWKQPRAQLLKTGAAPQRERQVHVAELTRALDANALHSHRHRQLLAVITEQLHLFGTANQPTRQRPRLQPPLPVELTEMGHRLLNDATTDTNAAHKAPIAVNLPVLFANRMAQIHAPSEPTAPPKKIPKVVTTRSNQLRAPANRLIRFIPRLAKSQKQPPSCASWVSSPIGVGTPSRLTSDAA
jgi:hypothetical protein